MNKEHERTVVELLFPVSGCPLLPKDNGYPLFAAISRALGGHLPPGIAVSPIRGAKVNGGNIVVLPKSTLHLRAPLGSVAVVLPLAGKHLNIGGCEAALGIPRIRALRPALKLWARIVTIKGYMEPSGFIKAIQGKMADLGVEGQAQIPNIGHGCRAGEPNRKILKIKNKIIVGFPVALTLFSEAAAYAVLAHGIGGRRHMGCGIFFPRRSEEVLHGL